MMDEGRESRFVCKLCNKKYPCGKSLGGHMRSHVVANSDESEEKFEFKINRNSSPYIVDEGKIAAESGNGLSSYGLRENPKKTWRAVDARAPLPQDKICKQCGKGFQSLKALCGHMACHSDKDRGLKDDSSWTSENQKLVMDSYSDTEAEERRLTRSSKSKSCKKIVVDHSPFGLAANNGSSSVSEIDGQDQAEVAMCLMLLSKDSGNKGGVNSVVESSDNNSVVLETKSSSIDMRVSKKESTNYIHNQDGIPQMKKTGYRNFKDSALDDEISQMENSDSGYFLDECAKAESDLSVDGFRRYGGFSDYKKPVISRGDEYDDDDGTESRKRKYGYENPESWNEHGKMTKNSTSKAEFAHKKSKYECFNCKKAFKSYQALGGHRPCHKRSNAFYESRYESGENSLDDDSTDYRTTGKLVESSSKRKPTTKKSSHNAEEKNKSKKNNKAHVCPFCDRVFKNGQALGGHKRSHFIGGHDENYNRSPVEKKPEQPDLLDLNLPAPEVDEDYGRGEFFSW